MSIIRVRRDNEDQEVDLAQLGLEQLRRLQAEQSNALVTLKNRIAPFKRALALGSDVLPEIRAAATAARYVGHNIQAIQAAILTAKGGVTCREKGNYEHALLKAFVDMAKVRLNQEAFDGIMEDARALCSA